MINLTYSIINSVTDDTTKFINFFVSDQFIIWLFIVMFIIGEYLLIKKSIIDKDYSNTFGDFLVSNIIISYSIILVEFLLLILIQLMIAHNLFFVWLGVILIIKYLLYVIVKNNKNNKNEDDNRKGDF